MNIMGDFIYTEAKPLPVILLLDTSGSMSINDNIGTMNRAIKEMLQDFKSAVNSEANISVAIITFGEHTGVYMPLKNVEQIDIQSISLSAYGMTPLGQALDIAKKMIEDKNQIPSRSYRPTVVLVTDGAPNDEWREPMGRFMNEGRSAKCYRMAMGIGAASSGPTFDVLNGFISKGEHVFSASDATEISKFFQYVSMSTTGRVTSANPNVIPDSSTIMAATNKTSVGTDSGNTDDDDLDDLLAY